MGLGYVESFFIKPLNLKPLAPTNHEQFGALLRLANHPFMFPPLMDVHLVVAVNQNCLHMLSPPIVCLCNYQLTS